jgi:hypothetical protein
MDVGCSQWGFPASTMTLQHHTERENLHHMVKTAEDQEIVIGYHCELTVYSIQLDKELHSVYEHFKSWVYIKSPLFYQSNSESNVSHQSSH